MEKGEIPWRPEKRWDASGYLSLEIPGNPYTGQNYSGINILILWMRQQAFGYSTHQWATYHQVKQRGGFVRKGEHGHPVVFYKQLRVAEQAPDGSQEEKSIPLLRHYTVFNLDQCSNLEAIVTSQPLPEIERDARSEAFIAQIGANIQYGGNRASYSSSRDVIALPYPGLFTSPEAFYATSLHEHSHWTGHESRLNRNLKSRFGSEDYAYEELIAELGAAYLCAELGLAFRLEHHASYLSSWLEALHRDKKALFKAAADASTAARYLNDRQGQ